MAKKDIKTKKVSSKKTAARKTVKEPEAVTEEKTIIEEPREEYVTKPMPENVEEFKKDILTNVVQNMVIEEGEGILDSINEEHRGEILTKVKEKIENIKKVNNEKVNARIDNVFGYLWNGQEMDW